MSAVPWISFIDRPPAPAPHRTAPHHVDHRFCSGAALPSSSSSLFAGNTIWEQGFAMQCTHETKTKTPHLLLSFAFSFFAIRIAFTLIIDIIAHASTAQHSTALVVSFFSHHITTHSTSKHRHGNTYTLDG